MKGGIQLSHIDWASIHRRLEHAAQSLERSAGRSAEQQAQILAQRTRALAHAPGVPQAEERSFTALEFLLAHERYALDVARVREVAPLREITALPGVPAFVLGIVNVRGRIVSVIDLRRFFELPRVGITDLNKVIILSEGAMEFGVLADAVFEVRRLARSQLEPPPPTVSGRRAEYLEGVTAQGLIVLDAARILTDPRMVVREGGEGERAVPPFEP